MSTSDSSPAPTGATGKMSEQSEHAEPEREQLLREGEVNALKLRKDRQGTPGKIRKIHQSLFSYAHRWCGLENPDITMEEKQDIQKMNKTIMNFSGKKKKTEQAFERDYTFPGEELAINLPGIRSRLLRLDAHMAQTDPSGSYDDDAKSAADTAMLIIVKLEQRGMSWQDVTTPEFRELFESRILKHAKLKKEVQAMMEYMNAPTPEQKKVLTRVPKLLKTLVDNPTDRNLKEIAEQNNKIQRCNDENNLNQQDHTVPHEIGMLLQTWAKGDTSVEDKLAVAMGRLVIKGIITTKDADSMKVPIKIEEVDDEVDPGSSNLPGSAPNDARQQAEDRGSDRMETESPGEPRHGSNDSDNNSQYGHGLLEADGDDDGSSDDSDNNDDSDDGDRRRKRSRSKKNAKPKQSPSEKDAKSNGEGFDHGAGLLPDRKMQRKDGVTVAWREHPRTEYINRYGSNGKYIYRIQSDAIDRAYEDNPPNHENVNNMQYRKGEIRNKVTNKLKYTKRDIENIYGVAIPSEDTSSEDIAQIDPSLVRRWYDYSLVLVGWYTRDGDVVKCWETRAAVQARYGRKRANEIIFKACWSAQNRYENQKGDSSSAKARSPTPGLATEDVREQRELSLAASEKDSKKTVQIVTPDASVPSSSVSQTQPSAAKIDLDEERKILQKDFVADYGKSSFDELSKAQREEFRLEWLKHKMILLGFMSK